MPSAGGSARRYAQAVFELARENGAWDAWDTDLGLLSDVFTDRSVARYFGDPKRTTGEKERLVRELFEGKIGPLALNVVRMLADQGRTQLLPAIYERFRALARAHHNIVIADVTTAVPVDAREREYIAAELGRRTGKRVEVRTRVDPEIIGGLVARVGDQLIDGSVRTQLLQLRQRMT